MDFGSWITREAGITEEQLRDLPRFRESDAFSEDEKLVLEYAEGVSRTPVEVPDEVFARMRARFDQAQIIELTYAAAIENLRARFNWALRIESQGYSEGAYCLRPEALPQAESPGTRAKSTA
jgi:alkylhydroperoxidase family enzyme